jgi:hypothetical protein
VHPVDDPRVEQELMKLHRYLVQDIPILVGGRGIHSYRQVLQRIGAEQLDDLTSFRTYLEMLRTRHAIAESNGHELITEQPDVS